MIPPFLFAAAFAVATAVFLGIENRYLPVACERDQYFRYANRLICGEARLIRSTFGPLFPCSRRPGSVLTCCASTISRIREWGASP